MFWITFRIHVTMSAPARLRAAVPAPRGWPVLRLGFRPFYLGAAGFGMVAVPLWIAALQGALDVPLAPSPLLWHAHELIFGFAAAAIVGVMLTASGKAWSSRGAPRGTALALLALLWLAARIAGVAVPPLPYAMYALLDALLLPLVAAVLFEGLLRERHRRSLPLGLIVLLLASANLGFHLAVLGAVHIAPQQALHAGLGLVVMLECLVAGRSIPGFTASAVPGLKLHAPRRLERATLAASAVALALWVLDAPGAMRAVTAAACMGAAVLHLLRLVAWQPWRTLARPMVWALHLAYAWLAAGFALLGLAQLGLVAASVGVHALGVGATGGLIIGMVTRTARSHTGRPARASTAETVAYVLVAGAALLRVALPLFAPRLQPLVLAGAAAAWSAAFGIVLCVLAPWLLAPRRDGRDG